MTIGESSKETMKLQNMYAMVRRDVLETKEKRKDDGHDIDRDWNDVSGTIMTTNGISSSLARWMRASDADTTVLQVLGDDRASSRPEFVFLRIPTKNDQS
jgi:hypothetical protein